MVGRWYEIVGISKDMYRAWKDDLRQDILIWEEDDKVQARIRLTWFEALVLRYKMKRDPYGLRLNKLF